MKQATILSACTFSARTTLATTCIYLFYKNWGPERAGTLAIVPHVPNILTPSRPRQCQALTPLYACEGPDFAKKPQEGPLDPTTQRRLALFGEFPQPHQVLPPRSPWRGLNPKEVGLLGNHGSVLMWTHTSLSHPEICG